MAARDAEAGVADRDERAARRDALWNEAYRRRLQALDVVPQDAKEPRHNRRAQYQRTLDAALERTHRYPVFLNAEEQARAAPGMAGALVRAAADNARRQQELAAHSEQQAAAAARHGLYRADDAARLGLFRAPDASAAASRARRLRELDRDIQNAARDDRLAARNARAAQPEPEPAPDEPGPPARAFGSRFADGFAAGWAWLHQKAALLEDDQVIRDGGDVPCDPDDEHSCAGCYDNKRAVICLPCGHCTQCNACWNAWKSKRANDGQNLTCPACRAVVTKTQPATHLQRSNLLAGKVVRHDGSWRPYARSGPIYLNAKLPDPMHSLLHAPPHAFPSPAYKAAASAPHGPGPTQ